MEQDYSQPTVHYWKAVKNIMHYFNATRNYGLLFDKNETSNVMEYSNVDWAVDLDDC